MSKLLPYLSNKGFEAGLDEAGRGCLAGPVIAAAVILPLDFHHPFLNDSKQLNAKQRAILKKEIESVAIDYAVAEVDAPTIDQINIYKASVLAMHLAVDQLKHRPDHLLVDGNRFISYPLIPHTCIVKGDSKFFSIAAASILAKTYRDELMEKLASEYPEYGWERNAGYPTIEHRKAILSHGPCHFHRKTFRVQIK
ncbi:ribonuclease HII [Aquirufa nivalisilvae]|uniref:ribonuclease HII n=1 Tax=Aquirufa nivalisilvae TaxID=2516557 RepID=UPI0022A9180B|nr:ribonuclease HII [Aquirufa nivalisilvae]MCZ2479893.1 ribonuclease HII [Aquirufa nivalisilvae]